MFSVLCENVRYCKEQKILAEQKTEILPFFEEYLATLKRVDELETSLRVRRDWQTWCSALEERATFFHGEYRRMSARIHEVLGTFTEENPELTEADWTQLVESMRVFYASDAHDLALVNETAQAVLKHYTKTDNVEAIVQAYLCLAYANLEYSRIVQSGYAEKSVYYYRKVADKWPNYGHIESTAVHQAIVVSLINLSMTTVCLNNNSVEDGYHYWECMCKLQASPDFVRLREQEPNIAQLLDIYVDRYRSDAFAVAMTNRQPFDPALYQKLMQMTEEVYAAQETPEEWTVGLFNALISECDFAHERHEMTADACWRKIHDFYYATRDQVPDSQVDVISYYQTCLLSLVGYLNESSMPLEEKRRYFHGYQQDIRRFIAEYDKCSSDEYTLNSSLTELAFDPDMYKLFSSREEKIDFIFRLIIVRHCTTFLHSLMVSAFAELILGGIIGYAPELLIGYHDLKDTAQVRAAKEQLMQFIREAAMMHDVGKNAMLTIIETQYRPLTDTEFSIIREHPTKGAEFLSIDPDLATYKDITHGHHKFYNGKGGYPADFDNTASPERIMIDIITLSDCMDAATDCYGRSYHQAKTVDQVLEEFRADAGVRYNPDIVALILQHDDLRTRMREIAGSRRLKVYYDIYKKYFM